MYGLLGVNLVLGASAARLYLALEVNCRDDDEDGFQ